MAEIKGKAGSLYVEVRPTVTLESAAACVMMLNLFLDGNEEYDLVRVNRGDGWKWELTDEPKPDLSKMIRNMKKNATRPFDGDLSAWPSPPNE